MGVEIEYPLQWRGVVSKACGVGQRHGNADAVFKGKVTVVASRFEGSGGITYKANGIFKSLGFVNGGESNGIAVSSVSRSIYSLSVFYDGVYKLNEVVKSLEGACLKDTGIVVKTEKVAPLSRAVGMGQQPRCNEGLCGEDEIKEFVDGHRDGNRSPALKRLLKASAFFSQGARLLCEKAELVIKRMRRLSCLADLQELVKAEAEYGGTKRTC